MIRRSVLDKQSVRRRRHRDYGQWGFGLVKVFLVLLVLAGLSLALITGYQFVSSSPIFRLKNIVVAGVDDSLKGELIKISGITESESLFSIDSAGIKSKIESHPWIRSVFLRREFPHTLHIRAENEAPVALALLDILYFVNSRGETFKKVERDDSVDFPVITGLSPGGVDNGEHLKRVVAFLNLLSSGETPLSIDELSEVSVNQRGALTIYVRTFPFKVCLGRENYTRKLDSLQNVIKHLRSTRRLDQVRSIDLNYGDRAIVAFGDSVA
jgi:cell division septal protein FtsQ